MRQAVLLVAGSAGLLFMAALWPRSGHPVWLALPAGRDPGPAFTAEGWRIQRMAEGGGMRLLLAAPDIPGADPWLLRAATGAAAVFAARPGAGCAPSSSKAPRA